MSDISFFKKDKIKCPVCLNEFQKEEMRTGGGRLIANDITQELRREYKVTEKYGRVSPMIFTLLVCPSCLYSALPYDFQVILNTKGLDKNLKDSSSFRKEGLEEVVKNIDFTSNRGIKEGLASYYLAYLCYEHFPHKYAPSIKRAVCSMRAAWLVNDLDLEHPNQGYDKIAPMFYKNALMSYEKALALEESGVESISNVPNLGPDTDKNYGFDGAIYLYTYLYQKYGERTDKTFREQKLQTLKFSISKIFGMGRKSSSKPVVLLERVKDVYEKINKEISGEEE